MKQFYDFHLNGGPEPDWMKRGIPFLEKGRDQFGPQIATPRAAATTTGSTSPQPPEKQP